MTTTKQTPAEQKGYKIGQQFKITASGGHFLDVGDIVVLHVDDGTDAPNFKRVRDGKTNYIWLGNVALCGTPAERAGLKIGETYRMLAGNSEGYPAGTLVTFTRDDKSTCPRFGVPRELDSDGYNYLRVSDIDPVAVEVGSTAVAFEDSTINVPVEITIITVKRKLTQAERDAIAAILNQ